MQVSVQAGIARKARVIDAMDKTRWMLAGTFLLALAVRVLYNLTAGLGYVALFDAAQYERIGIHLVTEHCFCDVPFAPTVGRPPLWPAIIGLVYSIFGQHNLSVRLLLSLVGAGSCVLVALFARDIFGRTYGWVAGIVAAFYPALFVYDGWLNSESLFTFLSTLQLYALYRYAKGQQMRWLVVSGVALSLAALTRPNGLFLFALVVAFALIAGYKRMIAWPALLRSVLVSALIAVALILPWSVRNYLATGYLVPVATGSGTILAGAYNDTVFTSRLLGNVGMWVPPNEATPPIPETMKCCTLTGEDPNQQAYVPHWIRTHLSSMPRLLALHFINIWRPATPDDGLPVSEYPNRLISKVIKVALWVTPSLMILLAALGALVTWREKRRDLLLIYLAIAVTVLQCVALYGSVRFRAPIEPELVLLAVGCLYWFRNRKAQSPRIH